MVPSVEATLLASRACMLRQLLSVVEPSPTSRLPGYLRAFSVEAAARKASIEALDTQDPIHQHYGQQSVVGLGTELLAHNQLVQTLGQATSIAAKSVRSALDAEHSIAVLGELQHLKNQQEAAGVGSLAPPRHRMPISLQSLTWHQSLMDGTPHGRIVQQNWLRQVILETRAVEASAARYQKEIQSAIMRDQAAALPPARKLLLQWFGPLTEAIEAEQARVSS
jgi:hypothetical protein